MFNSVTHLAAAANVGKQSSYACPSVRPSLLLSSMPVQASQAKETPARAKYTRSGGVAWLLLMLAITILLLQYAQTGGFTGGKRGREGKGTVQCDLERAHGTRISNVSNDFFIEDQKCH